MDSNPLWLLELNITTPILKVIEGEVTWQSSRHPLSAYNSTFRREENSLFVFDHICIISRVINILQALFLKHVFINFFWKILLDII